MLRPVPRENESFSDVFFCGFFRDNTYLILELDAHTSQVGRGPHREDLEIQYFYPYPGKTTKALIFPWNRS